MLRTHSLPALLVLVALGCSAIACGDGSSVSTPNSGARASTNDETTDAPAHSGGTATGSVADAPAAAPTAAPTTAPTAPSKPAAPAPDFSPTGVVTRAYQLALERAPDAPGLAFWVDQLGAGTTKLGVLRALATSPEFAALHAAKTDNEYVVYLYTRFLRRAPGADEVTYWAGSIGGGTSRSAVADAFVSSPEFASAGNPDFAFFF